MQTQNQNILTQGIIGSDKGPFSVLLIVHVHKHCEMTEIQGFSKDINQISRVEHLVFAKEMIN